MPTLDEHLRFLRSDVVPIDDWVIKDRAWVDDVFKPRLFVDAPLTNNLPPEDGDAAIVRQRMDPPVYVNKTFADETPGLRVYTVPPMRLSYASTPWIGAALDDMDVRQRRYLSDIARKVAADRDFRIVGSLFKGTLLEALWMQAILARFPKPRSRRARRRARGKAKAALPVSGMPPIADAFAAYR